MITGHYDTKALPKYPEKVAELEESDIVGTITECAHIIGQSTSTELHTEGKKVRFSRFEINEWSHLY